MRNGSIQLGNGKVVVCCRLLVPRVDLTLRDSEEAFGCIAYRTEVSHSEKHQGPGQGMLLFLNAIFCQMCISQFSLQEAVGSSQDVPLIDDCSSTLMSPVPIPIKEANGGHPWPVFSMGGDRYPGDHSMGPLYAALSCNSGMITFKI